MNKLKERLFGLIVVIALGVIFVPMLLENTQSPKSSVMQDVPSVPVAKNELDKSKPEVLATLKESPKLEQPTHDQSQPIADRPEQGVKPGPKDDLKLKEKMAMAEEKAEQERMATEKAQLEKAAAAKAAQEKELQERAAQEKVAQEKRAAALAEQQQLAAIKAQQEKDKQEKIAQAKLEEQQRQAEIAEEKQAEDKRRQAEIAKAKQEQARLEQEKLEQGKREQEKLARQHEQEEELLQARQAEQSKSSAKNVVDKSAETIKKPAKPIKIQPQSGWVVQMGSFAEHQNASALLKKLRVAGYPAFTRNVNRNGMHLTVVMVGPHARREDADRLCSTLAMKFEIDGIIVRYEPR